MEDDLDFYVTKCSMKLDKNLDTTQMDDVLYHNHQINQAKQPYPRGMIITSKEKLPGSKFFKLSLKHMMDFKPKDWSKLLKNQSCSTK
jgi:hypothetical protein